MSNKIKESMTIIKKLNKLADKYFKNINNLKPINPDLNRIKKVTILPTRRTNSFKLKEYTAQKNKPLSIKCRKANAAVYRGLIGYMSAIKMADDETVFIYTIASLINEALLGLTESLGSLENRSISIRRFEEKEFFRDCKELAALEFTLNVSEKIIK